MTNISRGARSKLSAVLLASLFGAIAVPTSLFAAPTARLQASRTSGPAPLAVFFDATGTTDSNSSVNTFRQLGYKFDFGDTAAGTWAVTGRSKNEQIGAPLAAHVFESPGNYTVRVLVKDASGASSEASVVVSVQSANDAFPSTRTVCMTRGSDFTGCPAGASRVSSASSWPRFQSGYRYLLRRGDDFNSLGSLRYGSGSGGVQDSQLGAYGQGAKPLVGEVSIESGDTPATNWHSRVVLMDLDAVNIVQNRGGSHLLILRNTITRGGAITLAYAFDYYLRQATTQWTNPDSIFLVENRVDPNYADGVSGNATRLVLMGNEVDRTEQHNVRIWQGHKIFVAHNSFTGRSGDSSRHALKIHSSGLDAIASVLQPGTGTPPQRTSQAVIADNRLGSSSSNINWLLSPAPQSSRYVEGLEDFVIEDNEFRYGSNFAATIAWAGRRMTERGNRNMTTGGSANSVVGHHELLSSDWNGPYYTGGASMKTLFSGSDPKRPRAPTLQVE